ncbi:hypothetical protein D9M68_528440 [compost metagenome]
MEAFGILALVVGAGFLYHRNKEKQKKTEAFENARSQARLRLVNAHAAEDAAFHANPGDIGQYHVIDTQTNRLIQAFFTNEYAESEAHFKNLWEAAVPTHGLPFSGARYIVRFEGKSNVPDFPAGPCVANVVGAGGKYVSFHSSIRSACLAAQELNQSSIDEVFGVEVRR